MSLDRRGLSLIEVVIVLALIAVLMALSLPMLGTANAQARSLVCRQNLADMGEIITSFAMDFERLPSIGLPTPQCDGQTLHDFIHPRMQNPSVLFCPSDETAQSQELGSSYQWADLYNGASLDDFDSTLGQPLLADRDAFHHDADIPTNELLLQRTGNQYQFTVTGTDQTLEPDAFTHDAVAPQREVTDNADANSRTPRAIPRVNHANPSSSNQNLIKPPAPPQSSYFRPLGN